MALNIKDPETDRLARALASATGESITVATRTAIEERLRRVQARAAAVDPARTLDDIIARARTLPVLDTRSADEILGYDEDGLPS